VTSVASGSSSSRSAATASRREQRVVALGDHHGVQHDVRGAVPPQRVGDGAHDLRIGEHADLHGVDADVVEDGVELRAHERGVGRVDRRDAARVLRRERRDHARAVCAERGERLQVGLDARAAARVGAGDREDVGDRVEIRLGLYHGSRTRVERA